MANQSFRRLHAAVAAVCPLDGVSGSPGDPSRGVTADVRIDYGVTATVEQRAAADATLAAFNWSDAAQTAWEEAREPERTQLVQEAAAAIAGNQTFLDISTPSNAQVIAQVRALTRQTTRIIARLVQLR